MPLSQSEQLKSDVCQEDLDSFDAWENRTRKLSEKFT